MKDQKQENGIGKLIFELRVQENISQEALSQGLCSISEFRKIELGEKKVGKMLLDAFFGRMGCAIDNFSIILEKKQYELYNLRNQIQRAYLMGETEKLYQTMEEFKNKVLERKGCEYQFYCKMKFLMGEYAYHTAEEMEKDLISIIRITIPYFTIDKIPESYFCREEIFLCLLLASMYLKYDRKEKAKILLENLILYIEKHRWDIEEKVRFYPQIAMLLFGIYDVWVENEKWMTLCEKVLDLLTENGKITFIEEVLRCYKAGMEKKIRKEQRTFTRAEKIVYGEREQGFKSIQEIRQEYKIFYEKRELIVPSYEYCEVYLLQEVIFDYRVRAGKSQSELGEALGVEWETVSRYENGKNKPNRKNYQLLTKEIGIPKEEYHVLLPVEHYIEYKKIRKIERLLFRREFILAEQLFLEILPLISQERPENRQYCIRTKAILDFYFHRISREEELQQLETAICCTLPNYCANQKDFLKFHVPSRYEATILNNIAAVYIYLEENNTASIIFQAVIEAFQKSKIQEEYHISSLILFLVNYAECLSRQKKYQEALEIIEKGFRLDLTFGRGNMLPYLCYMKGWNQLKKEGSEISKERRNACMKYYQQAYWISGLMQNFIFQEKIEKFYKKDFGEIIDL